MNNGNLQIIFQKYVDNFRMINDEKYEDYKWKIIKKFSAFNPDSDNFVDDLKEMCKCSSNLIDSAGQAPFSGLVKLAEKEPETVKSMFCKLYAEEYIDLDTKQSLIDEFIESSEALREKYYSNSWMYVNDRRSVMMYLFLKYPDSNYCYKPLQAKSFADCIGFYEDWGSIKHFDIKKYYKMCDWLVEEIKKCDWLIETHLGRYDSKAGKDYHPDSKYHILAWDIIYCSQRYNLFSDISFTPITAESRKLYFERLKKAEEIKAEYERAVEDLRLLEEAEAFVKKTFIPAVRFKHKFSGEGRVVSCDGRWFYAVYDNENTERKLDAFTLIKNKFLVIDNIDLFDETKRYHKVIEAVIRDKNCLQNRESEIRKKLEEYREYLEE